MLLYIYIVMLCVCVCAWCSITPSSCILHLSTIRVCVFCTSILVYLFFFLFFSFRFYLPNGIFSDGICACNPFIRAAKTVRHTATGGPPAARNRILLAGCWLFPWGLHREYLWPTTMSTAMTTTTTRTTRMSKTTATYTTSDNKGTVKPNCDEDDVELALAASRRVLGLWMLVGRFFVAVCVCVCICL